MLLDVFKKRSKEFVGDKGIKTAVVAYSGGIDSLVLSIALKDVVKEFLCVFVKTPYISRWSLNNAIAKAKKYRLKFEVINVNEVVENSEYRCYLCKRKFFELMDYIRRARGYDAIVDGTNYDDLSEDRPGLKAKEEFKVVSPLADLKIGKKMILRIAGELKIDVPPKETCLLMRFEPGRNVSVCDLNTVEELEEFLRRYVNGALRVRVYKNVVVIEVEDGLENVVRGKEEIVRIFENRGFRKVCLNLKGYRSSFY
ncbi:ATP-dependent sacrificial sulfur transferase LarE [Candidatus Woesearchaeota archaeon]|nr:ATP-dependent sacrificial sulfur transferase LarE [Candidatus Woesearchaeota archaeon]